MSITPSLLFACLLASLLAGCADDRAPAAHDAPVPEHGPMVMHGLQYTGCTEYDGAYPLPMGEVAAFAPAGFQPIPFDPTGLFATVLVWGNHCATATMHHHAESGAGEMWILLPVIPPEEYRAEGIIAYMLGGVVIASSDLAWHTYHHWGLNETLVRGDVDVHAGGVPALASLGRVVAGEGNYTFESSVASAGLTVLGDGGTLRIFIVEEGEVALAIDNTFTAYESRDGGVAALVVGGAGLAGLTFPETALPGFGAPYTDFGFENRLVPREHLQAHAPQEHGNHTEAMPLGKDLRRGASW